MKAGIEKTITDTKNDKSSFNKGFKEGVSKAKSAPSSSSSTIKKNKSSSGTNKKGGFKGGGTSSGAFK